MTDTRRAFLQIHACVLLWGFTAILGKLITLSALPLVWWRMLIVVAALALFPRVWRGLRAMRGRLRLAYAGIGVLVSLHWLTFYGAIKLSNASVGATCMALATVFTDSPDYPSFADVTADFVYARLMRSRADVPTGYPRDALARWAERARMWASGGCPDDLPYLEAQAAAGGTPRDVFVYFISSAKERNPAAAVALLRRLGAIAGG